MLKRKWNNWILNKQRKYSKREHFFNVIVTLSSLLFIVTTITFLIITKDFNTPKSASQALMMNLPKKANILASIAFLAFGLLVISLGVKIFYWNRRKKLERNKYNA